MPPSTTSAFDLTRHPAKANPTLIADDERHFAAMARRLEQSIADLSARLDVLRRAPGGHGRQALDRDLEVHQLGKRLRTLRRYSLDLCLGRVIIDGDEPQYIGRIGLTDATGRQLLIDWRTPAAAPFFAATHADPMDVVSRRRYRWAHGRISDYWDEVFSTEGLDGHVVLDDDSAFIAGLGASRSPRMRDVLGTIAADQDAIIRASSRGALVVDGGPGTGKTVVALHRAAYLLYADPRFAGNRGGVLVVGPHEPYLAYVADVLPGLGEESVQTCTLRDLLPEGMSASDETDREVARLKASVDMIAAIGPAVRFYEEPPTDPLLVETPWSEVWVTTADWAEAFGAPEPGTPHNEGRDEVWESLVSIILDKHSGGGVPKARLRKSLAQHDELVTAFNRSWPMLEAADLVGDLWSVPAYLRMCAPQLSPGEVRTLQRRIPNAWTVSDLPLLDAARLRLGDATASVRRRRRESVLAAERERMDQVVTDLLDAHTHDDGEGVMPMLRGADMRNSLVDDTASPTMDTDALAGPFAHLIVDEAQELTDAEWQMLLSRCPSRSLTVVGDRAQARHGFTESWQERLERIGVREVTMASLSVNYRTPEEVMAVAEPAIRAELPDANVPTSIRRSGIPVVEGPAAERDAILDRWLAAHDEGTVCVIGDPTFVERPRVRSLTPEHTKGLEFDLVVIIDPEGFGSGIEGAVDRYVAMTRATQELVILRGTS
ncbi:RNA polymerase recycling motor ATPase HelR [Gordonia sp. DT218]|uniref:RNA polymerase recycling motor ATPase HelR n=1 Tax=Gordonia sp. DT218 TaxID=3416659 RepID=UPI003CE7DE19